MDIIPQSPSSSNSDSNNLCEICEDQSFGFHYGVRSCFGCRGFFQRSLRNGVDNYVCTLQKNCDIRKGLRNNCRYCRYKKCVEKGMRHEAYSEKRDQMNQIMRFTSPESSSTINFLLQNENYVKDKILSGYGYQSQQGILEMTYSSQQDIYDSYKTYIHMYTDWAKCIPFFLKDLGVKDQLALIRAHSAELTILEFIRRTITVKAVTDGALPMAITVQGKVVSLSEAADNPESLGFRNRIYTLLGLRFHLLQTSDPEFILLKALMLLDPGAKGLSAYARDQVVGPLRHQIQLLLEGLTLHKEPGRLSTLLLLLNRLCLMGGEIREFTKMAKTKGTVTVPRLVEEVILVESEVEVPEITIYMNE